MILEQVWTADNQKTIKEKCIELFNIIAIGYNNDTSKMLAEPEAKSLMTLIDDKIYSLLDLDIKIPDDKAFFYVSRCIYRNIEGLVIEVRSMMETINYKSIGKSNTDILVQPFDNELGEANLVTTKSLNYTDANSIISSISILKNNSFYLNKIYSGLRYLVQTLY